jgi:hypothetical protein
MKHFFLSPFRSLSFLPFNLCNTLLFFIFPPEGLVLYLLNQYAARKKAVQCLRAFLLALDFYACRNMLQVNAG